MPVEQPSELLLFARLGQLDSIGEHGGRVFGEECCGYQLMESRSGRSGNGVFPGASVVRDAVQPPSTVPGLAMN